MFDSSLLLALTATDATAKPWALTKPSARLHGRHPFVP